MIHIELNTTRNFNSENVDYFEMNQQLIKDDIEKQINYNLKEIDWVLNLVFKGAKKTYENIYVENDKCKATYKIHYNFWNNEAIILDIIQWGDDLEISIMIKNKYLVEYVVVEKNKVKQFKLGKHKVLDHSLDVFELLKAVIK